MTNPRAATIMTMSALRQQQQRRRRRPQQLQLLPLAAFLAMIVLPLLLAATGAAFAVVDGSSGVISSVNGNINSRRVVDDVVIPASSHYSRSSSTAMFDAFGGGKSRGGGGWDGISDAGDDSPSVVADETISDDASLGGSDEREVEVDDASLGGSDEREVTAASPTIPLSLLAGGANGAVPAQTSSSSLGLNKEEREFVREALLDNAMFSDLNEESLDELVKAFQRKVVPPGSTILQQGASSEGGYVYVVAPGFTCSVEVDGEVVPEPYGRIRAGGIFGELAVMYDGERSATISAAANSGQARDVTLYRIPGDTMKQILATSSSSSLLIDDEIDDEDDDDMTEAEKIDLNERINTAIQQVSGTRSMYEGNIIRPYRPERTWLWFRCWTGTILQHSFKSTLLNTLFSFLIIVLVGTWTGSIRPDNIGWAPPQSHPIMMRFQMMKRIWGYQTALTTFILTFFVNQAYNFWMEVYTIARKIQGRLSDIHQLLATNAKRVPLDYESQYTSKAEAMLDDVGQISRLFHALMWASYSKRFQVLRTKQGLRTMASRGLMTSSQLDLLLNKIELPNNQYHNACVEWMQARCWRAIDDGTLKGGDALRKRLFEVFCELRGLYDGISGRVACR